MFRLKVPYDDPPRGIGGHPHLATVMNPLDDFATLAEAVDEAQRLGLNFEKAVIEDLKTDEQLSVKGWIARL
jgi:hypothetical protein